MNVGLTLKIAPDGSLIPDRRAGHRWRGWAWHRRRVRYRLGSKSAYGNRHPSHLRERWHPVAVCALRHRLGCDEVRRQRWQGFHREHVLKASRIPARLPSGVPRLR